MNRRSMSFASLGLAGSLLRVLDQRGHHAPTAVQAAAIPAILGGGDVWASASTGSGKTAAFVLPILHAIESREGTASSADEWRRVLRTLVLVPTRELAAQIAEEIRRYASCMHEPPKVCVLVGGQVLEEQVEAMRGGVDLVVATPGRLLDLVDQGLLSVAEVTTLVLDEADRLLALGFAAELDRVLALLPTERQNLLFSATFGPKVEALAGAFLRSPTRINLDSGHAPDEERIAQRAIAVDERRRTMLLRGLIETHRWSRVLVFVATRYATEHVARKLAGAGIPATALHGELGNDARSRALTDFDRGRVRVLVATDLAARGIDVAGLPAVVNYDLPRSPTDYVHRIGRTGRAGELGVAVSFVTAQSEPLFRLVERRTGRSIERERIPGFEPTEVAQPALDPHGGVKGRRKSKKDKLREAAAAAASGAKPDPGPDDER